MTPPSVIDTNVVVSGLITRDARAPTAQIFTAMLEARFRYLLSADLLSEYRRVLLRPRIRRVHGLTDAEVDVVLTDLTLNASTRESAAPTSAIGGAGDRHLWALLAAEPTAILVTGDEVLRQHALEPSRVVSPRRFLAILQEQ